MEEFGFGLVPFRAHLQGYFCSLLSLVGCLGLGCLYSVVVLFDARALLEHAVPEVRSTPEVILARMEDAELPEMQGTEDPDASGRQSGVGRGPGPHVDDVAAEKILEDSERTA